MPATLQLHLTRQPILDRRNQLFGYELLFQPQKGGAGAQLDDVYDAVLAGLPGLDLNLIADGRAAVITMGQNAILSGRLEEMEPRGVILALDEHVKPTPDVIEAVQRLKAHGYRIALDNMFYDGTQDALLAEAEFAKIETLALITKSFLNKSNSWGTSASR